ncbi:thyrotropin-releasing hormone receptor-like [Periplaneta americana]|uniref:thyrotropin-releasing hormone receptor-like n=1 Tax=Periplaneta americana TaxID=6978 RepID=UPI0037E8627D
MNPRRQIAPSSGDVLEITAQLFLTSVIKESKIVPFVELTVAHASVLTILAISFERYYAICEPLKASYVCTKARALLICLLAWLFAALFTSPMLLIAQYDESREYFDGSLVPACLTEANTFWSTCFFVMIISVFFLLPLCVLIVLYAVMARHLMADPGTSAVKDLESTNTRARKQVVLMLGTVVLSFFICLIPFRVFTLWFILVPEEQVRRLGVEGYYNILYFCRTMLYLNSAINPILYNLMSSKFRDGFMRLCGLRRKDVVLLRRGTTSTSVYSSTRRCNSFAMTQRSSPDFSWRSASRYSTDSTPTASPKSERRHRNSFRRSVMIRSSILKRNGSCIRDDVVNCIEMRPGPESYV